MWLRVGYINFILTETCLLLTLGYMKLIVDRDLKCWQ